MAISLAKKLNGMHALVVALTFGAVLGHFERNPTEVERLASELIELSTRQNFVRWLPGGEVLRGWARSALGDTAEGVSLLENRRLKPYILRLHLADRTSEALEAIGEAEAC